MTQLLKEMKTCALYCTMGIRPFVVQCAVTSSAQGEVKALSVDYADCVDRVDRAECVPCIGCGEWHEGDAHRARIVRMAVLLVVCMFFCPNIEHQQYASMFIDSHKHVHSLHHTKHTLHCNAVCGFMRDCALKSRR